MLMQISMLNRLISLQKLEKISTVAETNKTKLEKEAKRLEKHANSSCECWIWLLLFLVCATFISMVMFIRLFPKQ